MKIKIEIGNRRIDGEYECEPPWTNWEIHAMKRLTDLTAVEMGEALEKGDTDVILALGLVGLMRAGIITGKQPWDSEPMNVLWQAEMGKLTFVGDELEDDADPLPVSESDAEASEKNGSSGSASSPSSESPELVPSPTGGPT
jgi:hypothetical protein